MNVLRQIGTIPSDYVTVAIFPMILVDSLSGNATTKELGVRALITLLNSVQ